MRSWVGPTKVAPRSDISPPPMSLFRARPPTRFRASRMRTDLPARWSSRAAVSPAKPAPTTTTSHFRRRVPSPAAAAPGMRPIAAPRPAAADAPTSPRREILCSLIRQPPFHRTAALRGPGSALGSGRRWRLGLGQEFLEMLVRGTEVAARQRCPLAWRALARVRLAVPRATVEVHAGRTLGQELGGQVHVHLHDPPGIDLIGHADIGADLAEQPARRVREIAPVVGEPLDRRLAGVQHYLPVPAPARILLVLHDARGQLPVDGAAEVIHPVKPPWLSVPVPSRTPCDAVLGGLPGCFPCALGRKHLFCEIGRMLRNFPACGA